MSWCGWVLVLAMLSLLPKVLSEEASDPRGTSLGARTPSVCWIYDARSLRAWKLEDLENTRAIWDRMHLLAALQGLVNREEPRLYLLYCQEFGIDTDRFWLDWVRQSDEWLKRSEWRTLESVEEVVRKFQEEVEGLVVYDPAVPATSNAASTAAGCERLLPVRYDPGAGSLYRVLTERLHLPVRLWLVNPDGSKRFTGHGQLPDFGDPSSGSAKADVYRWAMRRYLKPGGCAPGVAAYYLDAYWLDHPGRAGVEMHTLPNHDYFVSRRGFFFDLSAWGDETPVDDPQQPLGLDRQVLLEVLRGLYEQANGGMIRMGGFTPWPHKYTTHAGAGKHEPVPTEWEFARLVSQFNVYVEADAAGLGAMANASFFQHYPLAERYPQVNSIPTLADWQERGYVDAEGRVAPRFYVGHYVGDYDSAAWLYKAVPAFFGSRRENGVPLGWAFNPNLAARAPHAMVYARDHAGDNDYFIAGNSGAGYVNVRALSVRPDSGLPSGLERWAAHCMPYYRRWDLEITGFILDGSAGATTEQEFAVYRDFSPLGLGTHFEAGPGMRAGMPTCPEVDLPDSAEAAVAVIVQRASKRGGGPGFLWARSILKSPEWYEAISRGLQERHAGSGIEVVDPYTFFGLIAKEFKLRAP